MNTVDSQSNESWRPHHVLIVPASGLLCAIGYLLWVDLQITHWGFSGRPSAWLDPHPWVYRLEEWYDKKHPAPPRSIKMHGEIPRVRATVRTLLLCTSFGFGVVVAVWKPDGLRRLWLRTAHSVIRQQKYLFQIVGVAVALLVAFGIAFREESLWEDLLFHPQLRWAFGVTAFGMAAGMVSELSLNQLYHSLRRWLQSTTMRISVCIILALVGGAAIVSVFMQHNAFKVFWGIPDMILGIAIVTSSILWGYGRDITESCG